MSTPFVGEIRLFGGNFAPTGWMFCNGATLSIAENETLFQLIGTTYGGDGQSTYALPDLRGRVPVHRGLGPGLAPYVLGQQGGSETVTLSTQQIAPHSHALRANTALATNSAPGGALLAATGAVNSYGGGIPDQAMTSGALSPQGQGNAQPHDNMAPYGVISYIISLLGIFPSQS